MKTIELFEGKIYSIGGQRIRSFKKQPNGRGSVYCVPMKELTEK